MPKNSHLLPCHSGKAERPHAFGRLPLPASTVSALLLWNAVAAFGAQPPVSEALSQTGVTQGFAVHLGCESGEFVSGLAASGKFHVQGLALDNGSLAQARQKVAEAGVLGMAQVGKPLRLNPLPLATNQVNLLIADLDLPGLSGVTQAEIDRVVAPLGASYVKKGGSWKVNKKPMPAEMDSWTHYDKDHTNSQASNDRTIGIANSVKWYGAQYEINEWPRFSDGKVVLRTSVPGDGGMECRDAFSGVRLWRKKFVLGGRLQNVMPFVFVNNRIYYPAEGEGKPVSVIDANTGEIVNRLDKGGLFSAKSTLPSSGGNIDYAVPANMMMVVAGGKIIQSVDGMVYCLKESDGSLLWSRKLPDPIASYPTLDLAGNRLFIGSGTYLGSGRDWHAQVNSIVCLNLNTGDILWNNPQYGNTHLSQIFWSEGKLMLFNHFTSDGGTVSRGNPDDIKRVYAETLKVGMAYMGRLNPDDGKVVWKVKPFQFMNTTSRFLVYKGAAYHVSMNQVWKYNIETGDTLRLDHIATYARHTNPLAQAGFSIPDASVCVAPTVFHDKIHAGGTYLDFDNGKFYPQLTNRSHCGGRLFPAFGSVTATGTGCKCWKMWRGYMNLTSDPIPAEIPEAQRLDKTPLAALKQIHAPKADLAATALYSDDRQTYIHPFYEAVSSSSTLGDMRFEAVNKLGRLDAYKGATLQWSFVAGGRIYSAPVERNGKVYFGSTDGFVYCLDKATGNQLWRFLVGPNERTVTAFSQAESAYPVFSAVLQNDVVWASAGRTVDTDGGLFLYGLHAETGAVVSKINLFSPRGWTTLKGFTGNDVFPKRANLINGPLQSVNGSTSLNIRFWDNATGTSGGAAGPNKDGWQAVVVDSKLQGVIDPNTMKTVDIFFRPAAQRAGKGLHAEAVFVGPDRRIHLKEKGLYTITVYSPQGRAVKTVKRVTEGDEIVPLEDARPGYLLKFSYQDR